MTSAGIDVAETSTEARAVLASAATLTACRACAVPIAERSVLAAAVPHGQDELLRLISVTGAIRVNADALPQSLRSFVLG